MTCPIPNEQQVPQERVAQGPATATETMVGKVQYSLGNRREHLLAPQTLPRAFMNEYVNVRNMQRYKNEVSRFRQCTLLAIIIWACLDPTNILVPPAMSTFVIAFS